MTLVAGASAPPMGAAKLPARHRARDGQLAQALRALEASQDVDHPTARRVSPDERVGVPVLPRARGNAGHTVGSREEWRGPAPGLTGRATGGSLASCLHGGRVPPSGEHSCCSSRSARSWDTCVPTRSRPTSHRTASCRRSPSTPTLMGHPGSTRRRAVASSRARRVPRCRRSSTGPLCRPTQRGPARLRPSRPRPSRSRGPRSSFCTRPSSSSAAARPRRSLRAGFDARTCPVPYARGACMRMVPLRARRREDS